MAVASEAKSPPASNYLRFFKSSKRRRGNLFKLYEMGSARSFPLLRRLKSQSWLGMQDLICQFLHFSQAPFLHFSRAPFRAVAEERVLISCSSGTNQHKSTNFL